MNAHSVTGGCQPQFVSPYGSRRPPTRAGWSVVLIHSGKHRVREGRRGELPGSTIAQGAADRPDGRRVHGVRRAATRARGGVAPRRVWNGPEGRDDVG